ncbi:class I SAM-dependent methyltransferase [Candidatus Bathyarchaeota archaeon]|nr:class I SAM-dependent methyltransferase [Candidatus Bathyarchaeota archaeon]
MRRKGRETDHYFVAQPKSEMRLGTIHTYFGGKSFRFLTASGVFSKTRIDLGTRLLIESMILPEKGSVLDVGCGYGAVGITVAASNPDLHVMMVDVNERAVWLAKQNAKINCVHNVEIKRGCLYEPVKGLTFDCVLSNPPVSAGMQTVKAIICEAPERMASNATLQMVLRSKIAGKRMKAIFEERFGNFDILSRESGYRVLFAQKR